MLWAHLPVNQEFFPVASSPQNITPFPSRGFEFVLLYNVFFKSLTTSKIKTYFNQHAQQQLVLRRFFYSCNKPHSDVDPTKRFRTFKKRASGLISASLQLGAKINWADIN